MQSYNLFRLLRWCALLICSAVLVVITFVRDPNEVPLDILLNIAATALMMVGMLWIAMRHVERVLNSRRHERLYSNHPESGPRAAVLLLMLILRYEEDRDSIIGDIIEEYTQFQSKHEAIMWLYKQILKSALPIIHKNVKNRLASFFGKQIR